MTGAATPRPSRLLLRASVCGSFDPLDWLAGLDPDAARQLAAELAAACEEAPGGDGRLWTLRATVRREQLARIDTPAALSLALEHAPDPAPDDLTTITLRAILRGAEPPHLRGHDPRAVQAARHTALQFARAAPIVDAEALERQFRSVEAALAEDSLERAVGAALPTRLYGRSGQLRRIRELLAEQGHEVAPVLITGLGGIGKSALVAQLIRDWRKQGAAVLIDFDRPRFATGRLIPIFTEIVRQIGWHARSIEDEGRSGRYIEELRTSLRMADEEVGETGSLDRQALAVSSIIRRDWGYAARLPAVAQMPILIVFDSFEAAGGISDAFVSQLLEQVMVFQRSGFLHIRIVVSCREAPLPADKLQRWFGPPGRWIAVEGIDTDAGSRLLRNRDRNGRFPDPAIRRRATRALQGNPLALIVLERFGRNRAPAEVAAIVADLERNADFQAEFAQSFLYSRILERIRNPAVARLAHPGLALRFVDPDMIRLVLAGPCRLGAVDDGQARRLFDALQSEYWLVEREGARVRHRPDLRRMMLPGLFAGPREGDTGAEKTRKARLREDAIAVCRAAADFYENGPPTNDTAHAGWASLPAATRTAEASYYRALAGDPPPDELERATAGALQEQLGPDVATLPATWRAVVKASLGLFRQLSEEERAALSGRLAEEADIATLEQAVSEGRQSDVITAQIKTGIATAYGSSVARGVSGPADLRTLELNLRSAFEACDWQTCIEMGAPVLESFARGELSDVSRREISAGRGWATAAWLAVLARCSGAASGSASLPGPFARSKHADAETETMAILADNLLGWTPKHGARERLPDPTGRTLLSTRLSLRALTRTSGRDGGELVVGHLCLLGKPFELLRREAEYYHPSLKLWSEHDRGPLSSGHVEEVYRLARDQAIDLKAISRLPLWERHVRSLTPELHEPLAGRLAALNDPDLISSLVGHLQQMEPGLSADLLSRHDQMSGGRNGRRFLLQLVLRADRFGLLSDLLRWTSERSGAVKGLLEIHRAMQMVIHGTPE